MTLTTRPAGTFITFEGLDGCGKTTQLEKLADALRRQGRHVVTTREPGGTPIGERIREVLLDSRTLGLSPRAELALMFASRAQQIEQVIAPALRAGAVVLCDRFTDSSEAYQGAGRGLGRGSVHALHQALCGGLQPDLTILLVSDVNASIERARRRNQLGAAALKPPSGKSQKQAPGKSSAKAKKDEGRFEQETAQFFERVLAAYLQIAEREPQRVLKISASGTIAETHRQIAAAVATRLKL